jgi:hypothetical protein
VKKRLESFKRALIKYIALVNYGLKVLQLGKSAQNGSKLFIVYTTVVKVYPVNRFRKIRASDSQSIAMAYTQCIVLKN